MTATTNQCWLMLGRYLKQISDGQKSNVIVKNQKETPLPYEIKKKEKQKKFTRKHISRRLSTAGNRGRR